MFQSFLLLFYPGADQLTGQVHDYSSGYPGKENVLDTDIWMAAEDFAYYTQVAEACFYVLGAGNREKGMVSSLHTPACYIDATVLTISTGLMAYTAVKRLGYGSPVG